MKFTLRDILLTLTLLSVLLGWICDRRSLQQKNDELQQTIANSDVNRIREGLQGIGLKLTITKSGDIYIVPSSKGF